MRKPLIKSLILSLSVCIATPALVGCGEQSTDAVYTEKLETLIDHMSRLESAAVPLNYEGEGISLQNKQLYTKGVKAEGEDGVAIPGDYSKASSYVDQLVALLPLARDVAQNGNETQKKTANAIIASILADEGAFLFSVARNAAIDGLIDAANLHEKAADVRIRAAVDADLKAESELIGNMVRTGKIPYKYLIEQFKGSDTRTGLIDEYKKDRTALESEQKQLEDEKQKLVTGDAGAKAAARINEIDRRLSMIKTRLPKLNKLINTCQKIADSLPAAGELAGVEDLKAQSDEFDEKAKTLAEQFSKAKSLSEELKKQVDENYKRELQLTNEARAAQGKVKYEKLEKATTLAEEALTADAKRRQLEQVYIKLLNGQIALAQANKQTVTGAAKQLEDLAEKAASNNKQAKQKARGILTQDTATLKKELIDSYKSIDKKISKLAFERMKQSSAKLAEAQKALDAAGLGNAASLNQISLFALRARVLHQRAASVTAYAQKLESVAKAGAQTVAGQTVLSATVLETINARIANLTGEGDSEMAKIAKEADELQAAATTTLATARSAGTATPEGQRALKQARDFTALIKLAKDPLNAPPLPEPKQKTFDSLPDVSDQPDDPDGGGNPDASGDPDKIEQPDGDTPPAG